MLSLPNNHAPRDPSIQIIPKVCKHYLHLAVWILRACSKDLADKVHCLRSAAFVDLSGRKTRPGRPSLAKTTRAALEGMAFGFGFILLQCRLTLGLAVVCAKDTRDL